MKKYILAIDPGQKGAAVILKNGKHFASICFDDSDGKFRNKEVERFILKHRKLDIQAYIEDVHSLFMVTAKSNFSLGWNKGYLTALVSMCNIPFVMVQPKKWQKFSWQGVLIVKKKVKGKQKTDTKKTSLIACNRLFPKVNLLRTTKCKTSHDGLIDAYLIAHYGSSWYKDED